MSDFKPAQRRASRSRQSILSAGIDRRNRICELLQRGLSGKAIAAHLKIGEPLVKYYLRSIYQSAGVTSCREWLCTLSKDRMQST